MGGISYLKMENEILNKILNKLNQLEENQNNTLEKINQLEENQDDIKKDTNKIFLILEDMRNTDILLSEGIINLNDKIDRDLLDIKNEFKSRAEIIEKAVKENSQKVNDLNNNLLLVQEVTAQNYLDITRIKKVM